LPGESEENQDNFTIDGVPIEIFISIYPYHPHKYDMQINIIIKNSVFWDVVTCRSCVDSRFGGKTAVCSLQPPAHAGSSLADFYTLKMEAIRYGDTSQTTEFFIVTAVKTSNRTETIIFKLRC
jgi:hypothetical protein